MQHNLVDTDYQFEADICISERQISDDFWVLVE